MDHILQFGPLNAEKAGPPMQLGGFLSIIFGTLGHPEMYRTAFKTCGFYNMWMAKAFKRMGGPCVLNMRRPILLSLAEHIMGAAVGRPSPNGAGSLRPPAQFNMTLCSTGWLSQYDICDLEQPET